MRKLHFGLAAVAVVAGLLLLAVLWGTPAENAGAVPQSGRVENSWFFFTRGFSGGGTNQFVVDSSGNVSSSASGNFSSVTLNNGSSSSRHVCTTATWNPGSLASSSVDGVSATSTDVALSGATTTDMCDVALSSATSTAASVKCHISGNATATIRLINFGTAALDLATGTARVCYDR